MFKLEETMVMSRREQKRGMDNQTTLQLYGFTGKRQPIQFTREEEIAGSVYDKYTQVVNPDIDITDRLIEVQAIFFSELLMRVENAEIYNWIENDLAHIDYASKYTRTEEKQWKEIQEDFIQKIKDETAQPISDKKAEVEERRKHRIEQEEADCGCLGFFKCSSLRVSQASIESKMIQQLDKLNQMTAAQVQKNEIYKMAGCESRFYHYFREQGGTQGFPLDEWLSRKDFKEQKTGSPNQSGMISNYYHRQINPHVESNKRLVLNIDTEKNTKEIAENLIHWASDKKFIQEFKIYVYPGFKPEEGKPDEEADIKYDKMVIYYNAQNPDNERELLQWVSGFGELCTTPVTPFYEVGMEINLQGNRRQMPLGVGRAREVSGTSFTMQVADILFSYLDLESREEYIQTVLQEVDKYQRGERRANLYA